MFFLKTAHLISYTEPENFKFSGFLFSPLILTGKQKKKALILLYIIQPPVYKYSYLRIIIHFSNFSIFK